MAVKKFSLEAVIDLTDKITAPISRIEKNMSGFSKKMQKNFGGVGKNIKSLDAGINKAAIGLGVAAAAGGVAAFALGKSFIDAGAEVEKYKATLTTMLGSVDLANQRFDEMSQFAASTPFELNEVVALGNQLQALGKYSKETMTDLGDLAAASGKPIEQVTGAFAKLVSGQKGEGVNMFRDLLISTKDWTEATGKGIKKSGELMATTDEMLAALPKILAKKGFSGMMDQLSKTYAGMLSNFADTITRFRQTVGTSLLPGAKTIIGALTKKIAQFSDITTVRGAMFLAKINALTDKLAKWIENFDIAGAIDKVVGFFTAIGKVVNFLRPLLPIIIALIVEIKLIVLVMTIWSTVLAILDVVAAPVLLTVIGIMVAVAALTVAVIWMVKHWDTVLVVLGKVGGFFVNIGQTIMKYMLMPLNLMIDAIGNLLGLLSKIPGVGDKLAPAMAALDSFQGKMNTKLTGTAGAYDYGGVWSTPGNKATESKSSTSTTTRNIVDIVAPKGGAVAPRGGMPAQYLQYGAAQ